MKKSKKNVLISVVMAALLVFLDQFTKFLAVVNLKNPGKVVEIIPNVFEFRYLENQSAAFGIDLLSIIQRIFKFSYWTNNPEAFLRAKMIFFSVITLIVVVLLSLWYLRIPQNRKFRALNILLVIFTAGAIGNLIDRMVNNYVVDFCYFKLINFPIFNVADIYVTVAAFFFIILGLFYYKEEDYELIFPDKNKKKDN